MTIIPVKFLESRRIFFNSVKNDNETIAEWFERIEILAKNCGFSHDLHLFLSNKFLTGLDDCNFVKICSQKNDLSLENSLSILQESGEISSKPLVNHNTISHEDGKDSFPDGISIKKDLNASEQLNLMNVTIKVEPLFVQNDVGDTSTHENWPFMEANFNYEKEQKFKQHELLPSTSLHADDDTDSSETNQDIRQANSQTKESTHIEKPFKIFECEQCGYKCKQNSVLERHKWVHREVMEFVCDYCGKAFKSRDYIKNHISRHFETESTRKKRADRSRATDQRQFMCQFCGMSFPRRPNLSRHIKKHMGILQHECTECGKRFIQSDKLKRHQSVHSGEKPFSCTICKKRFTQRSYLNVHLKGHNGDKRYSCQICEKKFINNKSLVSHRKTHSVVEWGKEQ